MIPGIVVRVAGTPVGTHVAEKLIDVELQRLRKPQIISIKVHVVSKVVEAGDQSGSPKPRSEYRFSPKLERTLLSVDWIPNPTAPLWE